MHEFRIRCRNFAPPLPHRSATMQGRRNPASPTTPVPHGKSAAIFLHSPLTQYCGVTPLAISRCDIT